MSDERPDKEACDLTDGTGPDPARLRDEDLNRVVAEEVMGWKPLKKLEGGYWDGERTRMAWGSTLARDRKQLHGIDDVPGDGFAFAPAISWADAGMVLERMGALGYTTSINEQDDGQWSVQIFVRRGRQISEMEDVESGPRAICLASLQAVRAGKEA